MDFHVNQATNQFVRGRGLNAVVTSAGMKVRDTLRLDVYFNDGSTALVNLAEGAELVFAIKTGVESDADLLAIITEWTHIDTGHYRAWLPLNTEPLVEAIGDLASISAVGELTWREDPEGDGWESTNTLTVLIGNDVYKGTEGTPLELPGPEAWLAERAVLQPLVRLDGYGNPNLRMIRVTGITGIDFFGPHMDMVFRSLVNGKEYFAETEIDPYLTCQWLTADGGYWRLVLTDGTNTKSWRGPENVIAPNLVEAWIPENGETETPVVSLYGSLPGEMVGRLCRYGSASPFRWFIYSDSDWQEITPGIIVNRDTATLERLFIQDGIIQTEVVTD